MPTMLIYIIRCKGYLCLTPYIWEVGEKGPYDRCMNATIFAKSSMNLMFDISSLMSTKGGKGVFSFAAFSFSMM